MSINYNFVWLIALALCCTFSPVMLAGDHDDHHHHVHTGSSGFIRYIAGQTHGDLHTSDHDDHHHHHHHTVPVRVVSSPSVCCEPVVDHAHHAPVVSRIVTHTHNHHDSHPSHLVKSYYTIRRSYSAPLVYYY